jgi:hypothetical protein
LNGKTVQHGTINKGRLFTVNLATAPAGLYILRLRDATGKVFLQKINKL